MPRLLRTWAGAVLLALAVPCSGLAQGPAGDSATGSARDCLQVLPSGFCGSHSVLIDAHSGPSGENPTGTVRYDFGLGTPSSTGFGEGTVTCLSVAGNVATIGFTGREFDQFLVVFVAGFVTVVDAGGPDSQLDRFGVDFTWRDPTEPRPGPTDCTATGDTPFVNEEGDLIVTHTPALPTSKTQCKKGGWQSYGIFKNQGDCVSFVVHQAIKTCVSERGAIGRRAFRQKYGAGRFDLFAMLRCIARRVDG
jgi:hypothetical protein